MADLGRGGETVEKVRVRAAGQVVVRLDREGEPARVAAPGPEAAGAVRAADAVLVSDYGRGVTSCAPLRELVAASRAPVVWDPHPRGAAPVPGVALLTPNAAEARALAPDGDDAAAGPRRSARRRARAPSP